MTGLGDLIASATKAIGVNPCGGCKQRQEMLNRMVPFRKLVPECYTLKMQGQRDLSTQILLAQRKTDWAIFENDGESVLKFSGTESEARVKFKELMNGTV